MLAPHAVQNPFLYMPRCSPYLAVVGAGGGPYGTGRRNHCCGQQQKLPRPWSVPMPPQPRAWRPPRFPALKCSAGVASLAPDSDWSCARSEATRTACAANGGMVLATNQGDVTESLLSNMATG